MHVFLNWTGRLIEELATCEFAAIQPAVQKAFIKWIRQISSERPGAYDARKDGRIGIDRIRNPVAL
jgi:hypothetical protein